MQSIYKQPGRGFQGPSGFRRATGSVLISLFLLVSILALPACGGHPRRSTGTVLNDQSLEYDVISNIRNDPSFSEKDHIKVEVHRGVVLLAGETVSEENKILATRLAEAPRLTERVVND